MTFTIRELNEYRDRLFREFLPYFKEAPTKIFCSDNQQYHYCEDGEVYYCKTQFGFCKLILN